MKNHESMRNIVEATDVQGSDITSENMRKRALSGDEECLSPGEPRTIMRMIPLLDSKSATSPSEAMET